MRRNGISILQSFAQGLSLLDPNHLSALRALAEQRPADLGLMSMVKSLLPMMGRDSTGPSREDQVMSYEQLCQSMGLPVTSHNKPFAFSSGVAIIPVHGTLLHRDNYSDEYATGYDYIRNKFNLALADNDVTHIVFDVNSPGGMVAGNFELCDEIYAARSVKPSMALVDHMGYSGGYSLASSAGKMVVAPSGGVGSIGVLAMHVSVEELLKKWGVDISLIYAGAHKVDTYPFNQLSDSARERFQAGVDKSYDKFVNLVARNRGMNADAVRGTEALCYDADDALSIGLIDSINTPAAALAAFRLGQISGPNTNPQQGAKNMADNTQGGGGNATTVESPVVAAAPAAAAPAAAAPAVAAPAAPAAPAAAATDPRAVERARIRDITTCEEAKGREELAAHLAHDTDMSVEAARGVLLKSPVGAKKADTTPFAAAMDNTQNPNVGANGGGDGGEQQAARPGDRIAENYSRMTGVKLRDK